MSVKIKHTTQYTYSQKVFLEPHAIRLVPRQDQTQSLLSQSLTVDPHPSGLSKIITTDGSMEYLAWFEGMTNFLKVVHTCTVNEIEMNPFNFIIYPVSAMKLPMKYQDEVQASLKPFMIDFHEDSALKNFVLKFAEDCDWQTGQFMTKLTHYIFEKFTYVQRDEGGPMEPAETFERQSGSCRDYAALAIRMCQYLGLAARFVSGYYHNKLSDEPCELHAWFEVYVPGGGWRGFDPTHGIACDHHHVALASSCNPELTLPVSGNYRGDATSKMTTAVELTENV